MRDESAPTARPAPAKVGAEGAQSVRPDGCIRILAWPWAVGADDAGWDHVLNLEHAMWGDGARQERLTEGLSDADTRFLGTLRVAAHAVAADFLGLPMPGYYPDGMGGQPVIAPPDPGQPPRLADRITVLLAGQAAMVMWLEADGRLTPRRHLLTSVQAASDHDAVFSLAAPGPTAFLYGEAATAPSGFEGESVRVDQLCARAREPLTASWHHILDLTRRAVLLETLNAEDVAAALATPAPTLPVFDRAAAARGALVAGYPRAAIDAIVEHWTNLTARKIEDIAREEDAYLAAHPDRAGGETLSFTPAQREAFRRSLTESLVTLVADRAPRADLGLRREYRGARRIYELRVDVEPTPVLAAALATIGTGRYALMAPHYTSTFLAQDAAWSATYSLDPPVMLWHHPEVPPACTFGSGRRGLGCRRPLLHAGPCDDGVHRGSQPTPTDVRTRSTSQGDSQLSHE